MVFTSFLFTGVMNTRLGPELQRCIDIIKAKEYEQLAEVLIPDKDEMAEQVFNDKLLLKLPMVETDKYFCPNEVILDDNRVSQQAHLLSVLATLC
jgi:hypothetical protein